jgi:hypothetical protein
MREILKSKAISRRKALAFFGKVAAFGVTARTCGGLLINTTEGNARRNCKSTSPRVTLLLQRGLAPPC